MQTDEFHFLINRSECIFFLLILNQSVKSPYPKGKVGIELVPRNCVLRAEIVVGGLCHGTNIGR